MGGIRLEGDAKRLLRKLQQLEEIDRKGINAALAQALRTSTLQRFKAGKGPGGKAWPPSQRVQERGGRTLVDTAQLRNSIHTRSGADGFAVGTNLVSARTHQFGARNRVIRARSAKGLRFKVRGQWRRARKVRVTIPARPFLGLSDDDMDEIRGTIEDAITKEV